MLQLFLGNITLVDSNFVQLIRDPEVLDSEGKASLHSQVLAAEAQVRSLFFSFCIQFQKRPLQIGIKSNVLGFIRGRLYHQLGTQAAMEMFGLGQMTIWRFTNLYELFTLVPALLAYPAAGVNFW